MVIEVQPEQVYASGMTDDSDLAVFSIQASPSDSAPICIPLFNLIAVPM
jgi:hypothetical protein